MIGGFGASYRRAIVRQRLTKGRARGHEAAVGGHFSEMGLAQSKLLLDYGFRDGHFLVDIGCGAGRLACALSALPNVRYLGLDVSPEILETARERAGRSDWRFERVRGPVIPAMESSVDVVTAFSVFTHVSESDTLSYLHEAKRVLRQGGFVLFSFLEADVSGHQQFLRPPLIEAIVTKLFWAPNVATKRATIGSWASETGLRVKTIAGPERLGQSHAVLVKP